VESGVATRIRDLHKHPEPVVTPDEFAAYLKVSVDTIHRAIRSGALPAIRIGPRLLRIRTEDAREYLRPTHPATRRSPKTRARNRTQ
jgi:excisionase family DNA binding protein